MLTFATLTRRAGHPAASREGNRVLSDGVRRAWNPAVDQRPAPVAVPGSASEVAAAAGYAAGRSLRVTAQGTAHHAARLGPLAGTALVKAHAMRGSASTGSPGSCAQRPERVERGRRGGSLVRQASWICPRESRRATRISRNLSAATPR